MKIISLDVCFLGLARAAASSVGRVLQSNSVFKGTGFMISERLFLTSNHVIYDCTKAEDSLVEFNCELDATGRPKDITRFTFAPNEFFMSSPEEDLDFTIVAVGKRVLGKAKLSDFGYCPIGNNEGKQPLASSVNIIQHPGGKFKQITLCQNQLVAQTDEVLHYYAKTKSGSSGSPVFNDQFELIGVHHYRSPSRVALTPDGKPGPEDVNEGIRISAIVKRINSEKNRLSQQQRDLIDSALACPFKHTEH